MIIDGEIIEKALIIDTPWVDYIIEEIKTMEMRSTGTKILGRIGIIKKGTKTIVALATITGHTEKLSDEQLEALRDKHCINYKENPKLKKWNIGWHLTDIKKITPVPYEHKRGAVRWVNV